MIVPYLRPQDTITQILQQTAERDQSRRNPIVIGPEFELFLNDGRDLSGAKRAFAAAGESALDYVNGSGVAIDLTHRSVDAATAELYGEDLEAEVASFGSALWSFDTSDATLRTIRIATDTIAGDGTLNAGLDDRPVRIGDVFEVESTTNTNTTTLKRKVVGLVLAVGSETEFDGVVLDGPIIDAADHAASPGTVIDAVSVRQVYTGKLDDDNTAAAPAFVANESDWEYDASLGIDETVTGLTTAGLVTFEDGIGQIFLSYKAVVVPAATEGMIELDTPDEITTKIGETKLDNWLARGALEAFKGNQNRVVYALRTAGDTVADFTTALRKIQTTDQVYALAIMTDNQDVMELARDHCEAMSNKYNKNFRRAYVGTDSPGEYEYWGLLPGGGYRTADLSSSLVTINTDYRDSSKFVAADVGATISVGGNEGTILEVLSDFEVLTDITVSLTTTAGDLIVTRPDNEETQAAFVIARSKALGSRRIANVWCDDPTIVENGLATVVPMKFIAAEVAGLRCALLPQQGLTMTEIRAAEAAPSMYTIYEPETLDDIAANGTWVITQESEGGDIFIRHQLTTSTTEGALAYEDNVGVIVDEFSYAVKDEFRAYIGRRNATPDTIAEIDDKLKALSSDFTEVDLVNREIGPPILAFFDENGNEGEVTVRQDGDLADTLLTYVLLRVPLPLNGINHYIDVEVTELLASEDN